MRSKAANVLPRVMLPTHCHRLRSVYQKSPEAPGKNSRQEPQQLMNEFFIFDHTYHLDGDYCITIQACWQYASAQGHEEIPLQKRSCEEMNPHFFTAPFYFAFIWFRVQGSGFSWRLRRLFLEDGILVSQPSPLGEGARRGG